MKLNWLSKYLGMFIFAVAVIAVYKTFDNFIVIIDFLRKFMRILTPFFMGFSIAYLLYPPCKKLEDLFENSTFKYIRNKRRGLSILSVYLFFVILFIVALITIIPAVTKSISEFSMQLPNLIENIIAYLNGLGLITIDTNAIINSISFDKIVQIFDLTNVNKYAQSVMGVSSAFINTFMALAISVYVLMDRKQLKYIVKRLSNLYIKKDTRCILKKYLSKISEFIYKYIYCQLLDALIVFIVSLILLLILKVDYALILSIILGLFNLIPYFGAILAAIIVIIVVLITSTIGKTISIAILLLILQQADANIIQPKLVNDSLSIKPFWVILGILIGGGFFGVLGIFLAVPVMALLKIVADDFLTSRERINDSDKS